MMNLLKSCSNNGLIEHQNGSSNMNRRNSQSSLYACMKLFQIFGINTKRLNHKETKNVLVFTTKILMKMSLLIFLYILISETFLKFKFKESSKELFVITALFMGSFLMWNHIVKYEKNLIKVIAKLEKMEKLLQVSPPEKLVKHCFLLFATLCFLSVLADTYNYDILTKSIIRNFTFGTVDIYDIHWSIVLLSYFIHQFMVQYGYFFVIYFVNFYVIVCRYMVLILSRHVEINERIIKRRFTTSRNCDICFIRYDSILIIFDAINSILGFPIFLASCYNVCEILLATLNIWKNGISFTEMYLLLNSYLLFTATVFTASAVNEVDKRAKKSNFRILQSLSNKERNQIKESNIGLFQMCCSPPFALTGWDIFDFTKNFYISTIGCFATYSLLIINL